MPVQCTLLISAVMFALQVLKINPQVREIDEFKASDFELVAYQPHSKIAMAMAV